MIEIEAPTLPATAIAANDNDWLIVRTNPRCERRVVYGLRDQKIPAYLPCEVKWKRSRLKKLRVKHPLFPGYLFVGLRTNDDGAYERLHEVRATDGVSGMVMGVGGSLAAVSGGAVAQLLEQELAGAFDATPPERSPFKVGQSVKIVRGKFQGIVAKIVATADNDQVRITSTGIFSGTWMEDADHIQVA